MKKKLLLFSAILGITYLTVSSYTFKPYFYGYGNCTGAPGTTASCGGGGCHATSAATTNNGITLIDKSTSIPVTNGKYVGGKTYTATLTGTNTSLLAKFGFQVCVVDASGTTDVGLITATNANSISDIYGTSTVHVLEQKTGPISGISGAYTVSFDWTAPAAGTGAVNFYSVINAVNGNNSASGDAVSAKVTTTFQESTAGINESNTLTAHKIYPNPCQNTLNIEGLTSATQVSVFDLMGKEVVSAQTSSSIDVAHLAPGIYVLRINKQALTFVKQ